MTSAAFASIRHLSRTGKLEEAVDIALGKRPIPRYLKEDAGDQKSQTQRWFFPDQDKLNRFCMYLQNQLGLDCSVDDTNNGTQGGYEVSITGSYSEQDIANIAGSLNGQRLDNMPASLPGGPA